jgi:hypothetical protein
MSTKHIHNISLAEYRNALRNLGCNFVGVTGGHEKWTRKDLSRPIIFQTHIDPIPERIIASNNRTLGITKKKFLNVLP